MNCRRVQDLVSPYLDDELAPMECTAVEEHLRICLSCQKVVEGLTDVSVRMGRMGKLEVPAGFHDCLMSRIRTSAGVLAPGFSEGKKRFALGVTESEDVEDREKAWSKGSTKQETQFSRWNKGKLWWGGSVAAAAAVIVGLWVGGGFGLEVLLGRGQGQRQLAVGESGGEAGNGPSVLSGAAWPDQAASSLPVEQKTLRDLEPAPGASAWRGLEGEPVEVDAAKRESAGFYPVGEGLGSSITNEEGSSGGGLRISESGDQAEAGQSESSSRPVAREYSVMAMPEEPREAVELQAAQEDAAAETAKPIETEKASNQTDRQDPNHQVVVSSRNGPPGEELAAQKPGNEAAALLLAAGVITERSFILTAADPLLVASDLEQLVAQTGGAGERLTAYPSSSSIVLQLVILRENWQQVAVALEQYGGREDGKVDGGGVNSGAEDESITNTEESWPSSETEPPSPDSTSDDSTSAEAITAGSNEEIDHGADSGLETAPASSSGGLPPPGSGPVNVDSFIIIEVTIMAK